MIEPIHEPSGAEVRLLNANTRFDEYITAARQLIAQHRVDLKSGQASKIIEANAPFEWRPYPSERYERGILLIHGLYDCPFTLRDIGAHFLKQGYLVRAVLLPGHGTVPGDLLNVHRQDWLDTVGHAITATAAIVDDFYILGYSLGGALSLLQHNLAKNLRALLLIAPGLKTRNRKAHWLKILRLFTWMSKKARWYQISKQCNYTRYNSHSYNPSHQAYELMKAASKIQTKIPLFIVATTEDETIDTGHIIDYFHRQPNAKNKLLLYSNAIMANNSPQVEQRSSAYPERNIIDFSHTCLAISPNNAYLGEHGTLHDFSHYHNDAPAKDQTVRLGAVTAHNLLHFTMQRLSYNPDFDHMVERFSDFIETLKE
jgi:esterase/lipase